MKPALTCQSGRKPSPATGCCGNRSRTVVGGDDNDDDMRLRKDRETRDSFIKSIYLLRPTPRIRKPFRGINYVIYNIFMVKFYNFFPHDESIIEIVILLTFLGSFINKVRHARISNAISEIIILNVITF